jgi:tetratricopeptide (TPR) repeat protein
MRRLASLLALLALLLPAAAPAQGDPRLDRLFERLRTAPSAEAAEPVEVEIWRSWIAAGGPAAESLVIVGITSMQRGDLVGALGLFDAVTAQNPGYAEGWNKRATVLYMMGALDASAADCAKVLALEPRHFGALSGLGLIRAQQQRWDDAMKAFDQALAIHPHLPGARQNLETLRKQRGDKPI